MESTTNTKSKSSEFNELLSKGSDALSKGDLETAEKHYSTALKLVSPERKTKEMRTCFEELGNIYLMKRKSGDDFTKATALYNAALARCTSTEDELKKHLISRIKEAEREFLSSILPESSAIDFPDYENDIKHKDVLSTIRDSCKEVIRQVHFECDPGVMPLDEEQRVVLEKRRTNLISTLFRQISKDMIGFMQMLIEECTSVLGNAPCRFAVIGLGSLARNEMTPYSDMEFAILLEDGAETESNLVYFRNITRYLHLKVLNLGETILPSMGITSLNDFYSGDPARMWFFDDGPKGFSFDGAMPWASKYPLGRKETQTKEALELIKTPDEMASLQSEQLAIKEGYHLADVLATSVFVTGDEELVKLYNVKVNERLQDPSDQDMLTNGSKRGFESLNEIVEDFSFYFRWSEAGKMFNVKKELYRFPSLVLNSLTFYYNLDSRNTWDVVDEMQKKQLITEDEAHNLNFILATASELRIRSYLGKGEQREKLTALLSDVVELDLPESVAGKAGASAVDVEKAFHFPNPDIIVRFFMTFFPLQRAIEKLVLSKKLPYEGKMFSDHNLYDCRPLTKALIHIRLMEFKEAKSCLENVVSLVEDELDQGDLGENPELFDTLSTLGYLCWELGEVEQAAQYSEKAAQVLEKKYDGVKPNMEFANSYRDRAHIYASLGEYEKALSFYKQDLNIQMAVYGEKPRALYIARSFNDIAGAYREMKNLEQAISFSEVAVEIIKKLGKKRVGSHYCVFLHNLLYMYSEKGDIEKALGGYRDLFETIKTVFGDGVPHPYLASALASLATAYFNAEDYEQAVALYKQALSMREQLRGRNEVHPESADFLCKLGHSYSALFDHEEAIKYFTRALQIQKLLYGKQISQPRVATTLCGLGSAYHVSRNIPDALEAWNEALKLFRVIHKDNFAHEDVCTVLTNLGLLHIEHNQFEKAAGYLEEAEKLWQDILVDGKPHQDYAITLNSLGKVYDFIGKYKEGYECCRKGLEMRRSLYESTDGLKNAQLVLAESFGDTGYCCLHLGDFENALLYFQRGLELCKEMNMGVADAYRNVSTAYGFLGRPLEAIKFGQEAIRVHEEHYGAENVPNMTLSANLCNLGSQYIAISEFEKAAEVLEKALAVLDGRGVSIQLAAVLDTLGTAYRSLENSEKALSCLEKALSLQRQLYGIDRAHLDTAKTLTNLGTVYHQLGRFDEAIDYFTESLNMKYALYGPNATHQSIAITLGNIGNVYYELGQYEKAIKYIKDSLQRFGDAGSCSRDVAFGLYSLGQSYEGLDDFPAAYQYYEKSLPIMVQVLGETHPTVKLTQARSLAIRCVFWLHGQLQSLQGNSSG